MEDDGPFYTVDTRSDVDEDTDNNISLIFNLVQDRAANLVK